MHYLVVYCSNSIFFEVGALKEGGEDYCFLPAKGLTSMIG